MLNNVTADMLEENYNTPVNDILLFDSFNMVVIEVQIKGKQISRTQCIVLRCSYQKTKLLKSLI